MAVEASIIVEFGKGAATGFVAIELDGEHPNNLDSAGKVKSSFSLSDSPVFLIQYDPVKIKITGVKSTNGSVSRLRLNVSRPRKIQLLFTTPDTTINLSYQGVTTADYTWFGNVGIPYITNNSFKLSGGIIPCSAQASYNVTFQEQWMLSPPNLTLTADETYTIYVVVYAEVIA